MQPGETMTVEVAGLPVAVANVEGEYYAFSNECPHQSTVIGGRPLMRTCLIQCPEHGSIFDVRNGNCVLASDDGWTGALPTFPTRVERDVVQISLER